MIDQEGEVWLNGYGLFFVDKQNMVNEELDVNINIYMSPELKKNVMHK